MKWRFVPQASELVENEVTQRDHFNNDEVDLSETIVREAVQNSLDAADPSENEVIVSFRFVSKSDGVDPRFFRELFEGQLVHARLADVDIEALDFENPSALIIEDFGTDGLTGSIDTKDDCNFSDFWRRHGKSHKSGAKRGRWGLGKLVYSTSSRAGAFFGVTKRRNDPNIHLMGQTVLNSREIDGLFFPPHGFFADYNDESDTLKRLTVPVSDSSIVGAFTTNFQLDRSTKNGLSVIIPFPDHSFERDKMIGVAIANYFYPIITGQLIVKFNEIVINQLNIKTLASEYAKDMFPQIELLFDFIEEIYTADQSTLFEVKPTWLNDNCLDENDFTPEELQSAREKYNAGEIVGIELPVSVRKKGSNPADTSFRVFVKKPEDLKLGLDIYVRGGLTLPGESKFKERKALGAMIAEDDHICDLLGDAENAAHTLWTMKTEKLSKNYISPGPIVRAVKKSVLSLYKVLADVTEERDENALMDFFWYKNPEVQKKRKKKPKDHPEMPEIPRSKPKLNLVRTRDGFSVSNGEGLTEKMLPYEQKIKVAYDVIKGNPIKKYSPLDFTVGKGGTIESEISGNIKISEAAQNEWSILIVSLPFHFAAQGFDTNRDLIVRLPEGKENAEEI